MERKLVLKTDIKKDIDKLKTVLRKFQNLNKKDGFKLIFEASFLIEKIIFYIQLENGVENVAIKFPDNELDLKNNGGIKEIIKILDNLDIDRSIKLDELFLVRNFIVDIYKKYKKSVV